MNKIILKDYRELGDTVQDYITTTIHIWRYALCWLIKKYILVSEVILHRCGTTTMINK